MDVGVVSRERVLVVHSTSRVVDVLARVVPAPSEGGVR